jgi:cytochrome P450
MISQVPRSDVDLFSEPALRDPFPLYRQLRDAGPLVWLDRLGMYAATQFDVVRACLRDPRTFSSARGAMISDEINHLTTGSTIGSDDPEHQVHRMVVGRPLTPRAVREMTGRIMAEAEAVVDRLVSKGQFDGVTELAWHLPWTIVSRFVGLPEAGRERMMVWGEAIANMAGPPNARARVSAPALQEMGNYLANEIQRDKLAPGSWGAMLIEAADRGEIAEDKIPVLMADYLGPALDTTIGATGNLLWRLSRDPAQWMALRADPSLIGSAILEGVRIDPPAHWFSRYITRDVAMHGVDLRGDQRVLLLYASANRDERKYSDPDRFDVRRNPADHVGWGHGTHHCLGVHLAKLEMQAVLAALVNRVEKLEPAGEPVLKINNGLHVFDHLPLAVH